MTVNELDEIVALTLEDQQLVYGSHLSGGGFGGCIVTLLHKDAVEDAKLRIMVRAVSLELSLSLFSLYPSLFLSLLPSPLIPFRPLLFSLVHTHIVCCCLSLCSHFQQKYRSRENKEATFVVCYPSGGAGVIDSSLLSKKVKVYT